MCSSDLMITVLLTELFRKLRRPKRKARNKEMLRIILQTNSRENRMKSHPDASNSSDQLQANSQSSLKDLILIAEQEIRQEKNQLSSGALEDCDSCYNSSEESEELEDEEMYEEMRFNATQTSNLYMSMNWGRS